MRVHYPRTPHLPWSPGASSDDVRVRGTAGLEGREVVVTEKLDGENTTLYTDGLHARSLDSAHHPSRAWVKSLHGRIGRYIPEGRRVCGENMYARHSIHYDGLESWFYAFSVWDGDRCLGWDDTVRFTRRLGVPVPPVLWRGVYDERALKTLNLDPHLQEGYVVRTVEGFHYDDFAGHVAKWVRRGHVQTSEHWMLGPVEENLLDECAAAGWELRSGGVPTVDGVLSAIETPWSRLTGATGPSGEERFERAEAALADVCARLDLIDRRGDARLAGATAAVAHRAYRSWLGPELVRGLGMPPARRVADLVGLHSMLHRDFPDDERGAGLARLSWSADLGVLHAVAAAVLAGRDDEEAVRAREQVEWSALHAEEAGLLGEAPLEPLRTGLREELTGCDADVADRCWAEARHAHALGRAPTAETAVALTRRWRSGGFPRLVVTVGPAGSGKSTFAQGLPGVEDIVSLDDLREARGSRSDQKGNAEVLRQGLGRLDRLLTRGGTVVWDATALNRHQRALVHSVARRRDALITHAVMLVPEDALTRRNRSRKHPVPPQVLSAQLRRFAPPYPGEAHRTWYVGTDGRVLDTAGNLDEEQW